MAVGALTGSWPLSIASEMIVDWQKEALEFLTRRCERELEFAERLGHIGDIPKLRQVFSKFG